MIRLEVKPLSVNKCWQGKRFKTPAYKTYEKTLLYLLPKIEIPSGPLKIVLLYGFSNSFGDNYNPTKPILDILKKKYGFNDKDFYEMTTIKVKVEKGKEFFEFKITAL